MPMMLSCHLHSLVPVLPVWLILLQWRRRHFPLKLRMAFNGLYGVIFQNIELFEARLKQEPPDWIICKPLLSCFYYCYQYSFRFGYHLDTFFLIRIRLGSNFRPSLVEKYILLRIPAQYIRDFCFSVSSLQLNTYCPWARWGSGF